MTLAEYNNRKVPEYYDTMYLDGFTPSDIYNSAHRKMIDEINERNDVPSVVIVSEIKKKWKPRVKTKRRKKINQF